MSTTGDSSGKKKLIIDEDWKSQVERERQEARKQQADSPEQVPQDAAGRELPGASFEVLLSLLYTPALMSLGQFAQPDGQRTPIDLGQARFYIDLLAVLEEKISGGATDHDRRLVEDALSQLQMTFVHVESELRRTD